jgi:hypothetical protein
MDMIKLLDDAEKAIATLMLEVNRLNDELELVKKELALQKLSDIGQAIEQEPVAWLFRGHFYDTDPSDWTVHEHPNVPVIPLYTQAREK